MDTYLHESSLLTWPTTLAQSRIVVRCLMPGEPISKQRPRLAKTGVYSPKATVDAELDIQICIRATSSNLFADDVSRYGIRCLFVQKTRQRRDIDNMLKLVMDACTGLVWNDDHQVTEILARKQTGQDDPRTEIIIYKALEPCAWNRKCEICPRSFRLYPSWKNRRFCSRACSAVAHKLSKEIACAHCGDIVSLPPSRLRGGKNFCNRDCKTASAQIGHTCANCGKAFRVARSAKKTGLPACSLDCRISLERAREDINIRGTCNQCGGPTTKKRYLHCRACRWEGIKIPLRNSRSSIVHEL